mgnify:CR=1 FL=1
MSIKALSFLNKVLLFQEPIVSSNLLIPILGLYGLIVKDDASRCIDSLVVIGGEKTGMSLGLCFKISC